MAVGIRIGGSCLAKNPRSTHRQIEAVAASLPFAALLRRRLPAARPLAPNLYDFPIFN
jgi:hypothetical protein